MKCHPPLQLIVSGFSGIAINKNYAGTAFALMDKVWSIIKAKGLKHKGLNICSISLESIEGHTNSEGGRNGNGAYRKRRYIRTIAQFADWVRK